ncbi:flotillin [Salinibacterium amurskyense]|uniref:Flotillin n=1 Tax=Salinibacterium amurskyense TaxID=205941 RepID=A0A2M9D279_9MICO|nr:flotillin family protein [Salinibacterium amurskyense]PJJ78277.1 flotillin [Salinibacterium amurskyense]RLQ80390.1 flotillin family protein [Salinibacterium amurskyense]GHD83532.1 flotillin [Salinibacterium amurskyense]
MEIFATGGLVLLIGIGVVILVVLFLVMLLIARAWFKVARADEALVVSGRSQKDSSGKDSAVTVIVNGKALVNPITQRHETISLRSRQVSMTAEAQSADNVTLQVEAVAIVKIGSDPMLVRRAAERFASQDQAIEQFTTEQLEGALRGVVATLSVVELMRERKKFSDQIATDVSTELAEQGLILDSFQIKGIGDKVGYIQSLGTPQIESKRREAELATADANREISKRNITVAEANLIEQTALDKNTADSKAEVGKANAEAEQAEALARARAEQGVLQQRAENRQAELDADVKRLADANLYKAQKDADSDAYRLVKGAEAQAQIAAVEAEAVRVRAAADADATRLAGEAKAASIEAEAAALAKHQDALLAQRALETLPQVMEQWAKGYGQIGSVTVIGGSGASGGDTVGTESAVALRGTFESIKAATGLDLASIIQGRTVGQAVGEGARGESNDSTRGATLAQAANTVANAAPQSVPAATEGDTAE